MVDALGKVQQELLVDLICAVVATQMQPFVVRQLDELGLEGVFGELMQPRVNAERSLILHATIELDLMFINAAPTNFIIWLIKKD